jgi:CBS domain-containing protein
MTRVKTARPTDVLVGDIMQRDVVTVTPATSVRQAIDQLLYHGISGMPVVRDDGKVVGVVSATDILRLAAQEAIEPAWVVAEEPPLETPPPDGYYGGDTAVQLTRPLLRRIAHPALEGYTVSDIMTPATFSVRESATLQELARFLQRAGVHRALVLREGRLAGIVGAMDIVRAVASSAP